VTAGVAAEAAAAAGVAAAGAVTAAAAEAAVAAAAEAAEAVLAAVADAELPPPAIGSVQGRQRSSSDGHIAAVGPGWHHSAMSRTRIVNPRVSSSLAYCRVMSLNNAPSAVRALVVPEVPGSVRVDFGRFYSFWAIFAIVRSQTILALRDP